MDTYTLLGIGSIVLALVIIWNIWQSQRIDKLQKRVAALEKK